MGPRVACLTVMAVSTLLCGCCTEDTLDGVALEGVTAGYDRSGDRYLLGWWTLEHDSMNRELHLGSLDAAGTLTEGGVVPGASWLEIIAANDGRHLVTAATASGAVLAVVSTDGDVVSPQVLMLPGSSTGAESLAGRALDVEGGFLILTDVSGAGVYDLVLSAIDRDGVVLGSTMAVAGASIPPDNRRPFFLSRAGDAVWIIYQDGRDIRASAVTAGVAGPSITLTDDLDLVAVASAGDRILALARLPSFPHSTVVIRLDPGGVFTVEPRPDIAGAGMLVAFPGAGYLTNGRTGDGVWLDLDAARVGGFAERPNCFPPDRSVIAGAGGAGLILDCRTDFEPGQDVTRMWADPIQLGGLPQFTGPVVLEFHETHGTAPLCETGNDG
jgi:hypothetical protein